MLTCINCGKKYDEEGWDPMSGDCPIVKTEEGRVIAGPPDEEYESLEAFTKARTASHSQPSVKGTK